MEFKKKQIVARSSTKAEHKYLANTIFEIIWLQTLIKELEFTLLFALILWCDNLEVTYLAYNPIYYSRIKHMNIKFHFVHDRVVTKTSRVQF